MAFVPARRQFYVDVDREKVKKMGVQLNDLFDTTAGIPGQLLRQRLQPSSAAPGRSTSQAEPRSRANVDAVRQVKVRNGNGAMVPIAAVAEVRDWAGPVQITRYNMFPAAPSSPALPARDQHRDDVLATMEHLADQELPNNMTYEWTELSYLQKQASEIEEFRDLTTKPAQRHLCWGPF